MEYTIVCEECGGILGKPIKARFKDAVKAKQFALFHLQYSTHETRIQNAKEEVIAIAKWA